LPQFRGPLGKPGDWAAVRAVIPPLVIDGELITGEENEMPTLGDIKKKKGKGGPPILKGGDVPAKTNSFTIKVKELREPPDNFNATALLDFAEPVFGAECMALNITNLKALAIKMGFDANDFDSVDFEDLANKAKGKKLTINMALVNNPQTKQMVRGLFIA
jgi:hypothetical protein